MRRTEQYLKRDRISDELVTQGREVIVGVESVTDDDRVVPARNQPIEIHYRVEGGAFAYPIIYLASECVGSLA